MTSFNLKKTFKKLIENQLFFLRGNWKFAASWFYQKKSLSKRTLSWHKCRLCFRVTFVFPQDGSNSKLKSNFTLKRFFTLLYFTCLKKCKLIADSAILRGKRRRKNEDMCFTSMRDYLLMYLQKFYKQQNPKWVGHQS